ncbi:MAG: esterase family protein [Muribaculaceae bacterium]|nr:esterase family protein [Muribaculaceae bacterium]
MTIKGLRRAVAVVAWMMLTLNAFGQLPAYVMAPADATPKPGFGSLSRYTVTSESLGADIVVDVWLPEGYGSSEAVRYPVIYAQDGQNLFDPDYTFAGVAWELDQTCDRLYASGDIDIQPIIVGINNRGSEGLRPSDYFPEKSLEYIPESEMPYTHIYTTCGGAFLGDEYARFVAEELKPMIDALYRTNPAPSRTFAMGSSMGALASLYLMCEYPETFGGAACLSTHWIGSLDLNPDYSMNDDEVCATAILDYLRDALPSAGSHRLYLDQGTTGWDASYLVYEAEARRIARAHGYSESEGSLLIYDAKGAGHNEWFWQQRVDRPLRFLLSFRNSALSDVIFDNAADCRRVYDLNGNVFSLDAMVSLPSGIYIVNGRKVWHR